MGYATHIYAVQLDRVRAVFGSDDDGLFRRIQRRNAQVWRHNGRVNADAIARGEPSDARALREVIAGRVTRPEYAPIYGRALRAICSDLGTRLGELPDIRLLQLGSPLERFRLPVPLPPWDDLPIVSYLSEEEEVAAEVERISAMELSRGDPGLTRERQQYGILLGQAKEAGRAVVTFYS